MNYSDIQSVLERTLDYSKRQDYRGYDKADGLSSPLRTKIGVNNKWMNILLQEGVKRAPFNIRPLFGIPKKRNYKGIALFQMAYHNLWMLTKDEKHQKESKRLARYLWKNRYQDYSGICWGHRHPLQGISKQTSANTPNIVTTSYVIKALIETNSIQLDGIEDVVTVTDFLYDDLEYHSYQGGARHKYTPKDPSSSYTLNANALGSRLLIDIYKYTNKTKYLDSAERILDYVVSNQEKSGGWMYRDPASASHVSMDNYHNGFIVESLLTHRRITNSTRFENNINRALKFYQEVLYDEKGAPNWDENKSFPRDIHAAAQGIVVFSHANNLKFARRIIDWVLRNLYNENGQFYYQKRKYYIKRFTLMRWCQAWMAYAISEYLNEVMNS